MLDKIFEYSAEDLMNAAIITASEKRPIYILFWVCKDGDDFLTEDFKGWSHNFTALNNLAHKIILEKFGGREVFKGTQEACKVRHQIKNLRHKSVPFLKEDLEETCIYMYQSFLIIREVYAVSQNKYEN